MTRLLTAAGMRAIEAAAFQSGRVSSRALMERAGESVVAAIIKKWPEWHCGDGCRAVILCGPGNNGGDGYVVARLLHERGWQVDVFALGAPSGLSPDARANADLWAGLGVSRPLDLSAPVVFGGADLVVDALFGIGLTRAVAGGAALWRQARAAGSRLVAIDIVSGLCADSGRWLGGGDLPPSFDLTVTFHAPKRGHYLAEGGMITKSLSVMPLGLDEFSGAANQDDRCELIERPGGTLLARLMKSAGHKFAHGHLLVAGGGSGHGGAARLSARGALRIGAGLVTLAPPPEALAENAARLDAVMLHPAADGAEMAILLLDARLNALCLGPGLGLNDRAESLIAMALLSGRAALLDADALTLVARKPDLFQALHENCVLTPHEGEFGRLFPDIAERLQAPTIKAPVFSRLDAAKEASARAGAVVLLKGPDTIIAAPDGRLAVSAAVREDQAPWLATAGAGDVLSGFIAGLMARGFEGFEAACLGAWLHAECAREFGPGLIAEDLADVLPQVLRKLIP